MLYEVYSLGHTSQQVTSRRFVTLVAVNVDDCCECEGTCTKRGTEMCWSAGTITGTGIGAPVNAAIPSIMCTYLDVARRSCTG